MQEKPELIKLLEEKDKHSRRLGLYRCFCGKEFIILPNSINTGNTKSCGCLKKKNDLPEWPKFLKEVDRIRKTQRRGLFLCKCGKEFETNIHSVTSGNTKSCGCSRKISCQKHGGKYTPEYAIWCSMKDRCYNPNNKTYEYYGGRGVYICEEWKNDFSQFYKDMGPKPTPSSSIHRVNDALCYSKNTCVWASKKEQARERRSNRILELHGVKKTVIEWAEITGLSRMLICGRIDRLGWTVEDALTLPVTYKSIKKKVGDNSQTDHSSGFETQQTQECSD